MSEVIKLAPPQPTVTRVSDRDTRVVRTDTINVVFTRADETFAAVRVASALGSAMAASVRVVHFRPVPYPLPLDAPVSVAPAGTDEFIQQVRSAGIDVRVRVFLCRNPDLAIPTAFKHHSLVVIGGRRRRWPGASERLRRRLEASGHLVVFVDCDEYKERSRA